MSAAVTFPGLDRPVVPCGVGTWAWGDKSTWGMGGYDSDLDRDSIRGAFEASIEAGLTLFDTAEVYGNGESERNIGALLADDPGLRSSVVVATKFMPYPWMPRMGLSLRRSLEQSLGRLGVDSVGLYQIHGPTSFRPHAVLADALAAAHADGLVKAVGVSNYSEREMRGTHRALARRGLPLASNQIELSLLRRHPETSGLLAACRELGVVPLAYSPLGQGRLSGKYSARNPPPGKRGFSDHPMATVDSIVTVLRVIAEAHEATPSQVALAWIIAKGAVPIPGAKNADQARQNAGCLDVDLTVDEMATLDAAALDGIRSIQNRVWQHG